MELLKQYKDFSSRLKAFRADFFFGAETHNILYGMREGGLEYAADKLTTAFLVIILYN